MNKVTVINRLPWWQNRTNGVLEDALRETAKDILILAKNRAPFKKGALRREADVSQVGKHKHRVSFWIEYARAQEEGRTSKAVFKRYSAAGTGAHFLERSGDEKVTALNAAIVKHSMRIM